MELQRDKKLVLTRQCKPATEPTNPGSKPVCPCRFRKYDGKFWKWVVNIYIRV